MPGYAEMAERSWHGTALRCVFASLGDAALTTILCGAVTPVARRSGWRTGDTFKFHVTLAGLGVVAAVVVEEIGLGVRRWSYTARMPLVPGLAVGMWPVIQLSLLVPLAAWLTSRLCNQRRDHQ